MCEIDSQVSQLLPTLGDVDPVLIPRLPRGTAFVSGTARPAVAVPRDPRDRRRFLRRFHSSIVSSTTYIWLCAYSCLKSFRRSFASAPSSMDLLGAYGSSRRAGRRATTPAAPQASAGARPFVPCLPVITPALCLARREERKDYSDQILRFFSNESPQQVKTRATRVTSPLSPFRSLVFFRTTLTLINQFEFWRNR